MAMTIYKLFSDTTGDSVANLDIQLDGVLESLLMTGQVAGCDALGDGFMGEVSFSSMNSFNTHDVRGSMMIIQSQAGLLTQGGWNAAVNQTVSYLEVPINAGERVHMHVANLGSPGTVKVHAFLYVRDKGTARTPARRR